MSRHVNVCNHSQSLLLEPIPAVSGRGQGTPWTSCQLITDITEAAMQGVNLTSGAIWGSVSCSRTFRQAAQLSPELGFEPATFQLLANLLYPEQLSYSRPPNLSVSIKSISVTPFCNHSLLVSFLFSIIFFIILSFSQQLIIGKTHTST